MPLDSADPLLAVVAPPRVARFRELAGLGDDAPIAVDFSGWSKLVLLTEDRAFLFARDHTQVPSLEQEVEALRTVESLGLEEVPRVLEVWDDPSVSAHPVVVTTRLPGSLLGDCIEDLTTAELGGVLAQIGEMAARWHVADPGRLAERPARTHPPQVLADELLGTSGTVVAPKDLATQIGPQLRLGLAAQARLADALREARRLPLALVHGDLHEGQLLVDDDLRVTGIFDWQTARVGHPFTEFDLGEWGTGTWRHHRSSFPDLRAGQWDAYASARGLSDGLGWCFEVVWSVIHALRWPESVFVGASVTGSQEDAFAAAHRALT